MTAPVLGDGGARYYRHSGKVPAGAVAMGLLTASLGGGTMGLIYGMVGFWAHLIPVDKLFVVAEVLLVGGMGFAVGLLPTFIFKAMCGRSTVAALGVVLMTYATAMYAAWVGWLYAFALYTDAGVGIFTIARPDVLIDVIGQIDQTGVWYMLRDVKPTGLFLALIWLTEAGVILGIALYQANDKMKRQVFCEQCQKWGTSRHLAAIRAENLGDLQAALESGNMEALAAATPKRMADSHWAVVDLEGCGSCDTLQTLNLAACTETRDKNGKAVIKVKPLIRRMVLTPEQTVQLAMIAAEKAEGTLKEPPV